MRNDPYDKTITALQEKLDADSTLSDLLVQSLEKAKLLGEAELDSKLYAALKWPQTIPDYLDYLAWFARWIPHQSSDPAWTEPGTDEQQEVYDHLCHFTWLIDQKVGPDKNKIVQNNDWFSTWLIAYANDWGRFLDTTESFNDAALQSFIDNSPEYTVEDSMITHHGKLKPNAPSGWLTFNQFFARELNPGLRPIASPEDNSIVTSPADCTYRAQYPIDANSQIEEITIKKTHKFASIEDLLDGSDYKDRFANGTFVHYFLGPYSYHRFHTPVAGILKECRPHVGKVYLDVELQNGQFDAPDNSTDGYEFSQSRGIVIIDTSNSPEGDIGLVAVVPVGMCQVSSVQMTGQVGNFFQKGDEFGYFLFGGSDIILLFQEGVNPQISTGSTYRLYGTQVARV